MLNVGHGLVVESTLGHVQVMKSMMRDNYGNGIKVKFLDMRFVIINDQMTFCNIPNLQRQTFPQIITGIPSFSNSCGRVGEQTADDYYYYYYYYYHISLFFWTSFSDAAMTSSGDVTSALSRQMRIVSTASFGISLRIVFLSSDRRKNPPRNSWNTSM